jgi:hypothetical protein
VEPAAHPGNKVNDAGDELLSIAQDRTLGKTRQMVVYSLWRYRKDTRIRAVLENLIADPDVSLHAMSTFRRTIRSEAALPHLRRIESTHPTLLFALMRRARPSGRRAKFGDEATRRQLDAARRRPSAFVVTPSWPAMGGLPRRSADIAPWTPSSPGGLRPAADLTCPSLKTAGRDLRQ